MGLLSQEPGDKDVAAIRRAANQVATLWNEYGGPEGHGFRLEVGKDETKACSDVGASILKEFFYDPPSPFKRVAGLVVLSRLAPFFGFKPLFANDTERRTWLARISAMLIPVALRELKVQVADLKGPSKWMPLDKWTGFPTPHMKLEFLLHLEWLSDYDSHTEPKYLSPAEWEQVRRGRIARMVFATSLMIESMYYLNEVPAAEGLDIVRGKCRNCLSDVDLSPITYDGILFVEWAKKHKK